MGLQGDQGPLRDSENTSGKLCKGSTGFIKKLTGVGSCVGPTGLNDDVESIPVLPGCKLEVWDESDGVEKQIEAERQSENAGSKRDSKDSNNGEKLTLEGFGEPNYIEELNDDHDDLNEDISSFRCTC